MRNSSNGRTIGFCSQRRGKYEVCLITADGTSERELIRRHYDKRPRGGPGNQPVPTWQPLRAGR